MAKITALGRNFFAIAVTASGLQQLITGEFVRLVPGFPAWIPWPGVWARLSGVVLLTAGVAILAAKAARMAALVLTTMILLLFLLLHLPMALTNPSVGFMWTNPAKTMALCGGAILLAGMLPEQKSGGLPAAANPAGRLVFLGPVFLGVFFFICGCQHFDYADFVDTLVPAWIPPGLRFWTYFSGVALLAGGIGVILPGTRRPAAVLSGCMVFLWVLLLHIPRTAALKTTFELDGVFEALAISGVAFLVADTRPATQGQAGPAR